MNSVYLYATIAFSLSMLGMIGGCTSCPEGTTQQNGTCQRLSPAAAEAAGNGTEGPLPGDQTKTNAATVDSASGANSGGMGTDGAAGTEAAAKERNPSAQAKLCASNAGKSVCDAQGMLLNCDANGAAEVVATCKSAELCEAGLSTGSCGVCLAGDAMCDGAMLMRCSADASAYVPESDCMSAQLCDQVQGECKTSACKPDAYACDGDRLNVCKPDLTGYQFAKQCPKGLCDADNKGCKQCNPGAMSCEANTIMVCDGRGEHLEPGASCEGQTPVCDAARGCVECVTTSDCKTAHDCADVTGCSAGVCQYAAKMRRTAVGDGSLVRAGNPDPDPIYVVFGGALFYIASEDELTNHYGGFGKVQIKALTYARCPVPGTLISERGDSVGYIYVSDGKQLNWVKSPSDLEMFCGGSASISVVPAGSLSTTVYPPPAGLCPVNKK